jgi:DNA-binding XRE family transcriptional regulator
VDLKEFGLRVRLVRVRHRLTQWDVAKITGTSQKNISLIENGKLQNVQPEWIARFCEYFSVPDLMAPDRRRAA